MAGEGRFGSGWPAGDETADRRGQSPPFRAEGGKRRRTPSVERRGAPTCRRSSLHSALSGVRVLAIRSRNKDLPCSPSMSGAAGAPSCAARQPPRATDEERARWPSLDGSPRSAKESCGEGPAAGCLVRRARKGLVANERGDENRRARLSVTGPWNSPWGGAGRALGGWRSRGAPALVRGVARSRFVAVRRRRRPAWHSVFDRRYERWATYSR
jgi:hypothetical protein